MNDRIRRLYEMFLNVLTFMTANIADFKNVPFVEPTVAALRAETEILGGLGADKVTDSAAAKDSTIFRGDAREELRDDLEYLAEVWRSIPDKTGGAENKFKLTRGNNDRTLIAEGKSFAVEAEPEEVNAILAQQGVTAEFIAGLAIKTEVFERLVSESEAAYGERVGTNAAFTEPARRAKALVEKLAPTVKHTYRNNPKKLAEWLVARHVEQPPKSAVNKKPTVENK